MLFLFYLITRSIEQGEVVDGDVPIVTGTPGRLDGQLVVDVGRNGRLSEHPFVALVPTSRPNRLTFEFLINFFN